MMIEDLKNLVDPKRKFGIAVLTCGRLFLLKRVLAAIRKNTADLDYVLFVSDGGSADGTLDYLAAEGIDHSTGPFGRPANTRNRAIAFLFRAGVEVMFIFEDDCYPAKPYWWVPYAAVLERSYIKYLTYLPPGHQVVGRLDLGFIELELQDYTVSPMTALARDAILLIGGYDESFVGYGYEDVDYAVRAARAGIAAPVGLYANVPGSSEYLKTITTPSVLSEREKAESLPRNRAHFEENMSRHFFIPLPEAA